MRFLMVEPYTPDNLFDFSKVTTSTPVKVQGDTYFSKLGLVGNIPLCIQTPKCLTKNGIIKNGKKMYCDLIFDKSSDDFIEWVENLEARCYQLISENSNKWFQSKLDISDVEKSFTSITSTYKSGKFKVVRALVKNENEFRMFDDSETSMDVHDITSDIIIIPVLEISGIKFTSKQFHIEIELKQVMILNNSYNNYASKCLIDKNKIHSYNILNIKEHLEEPKIMEAKPVQLINEKKEQDLNNECALVISTSDYPECVDNAEIDILYKENDNIKEIVDFVFDNNEEPLVLRKPLSIYYGVYKEARKKAKIAKREAHLALIEAKNIKKMYMLDNVNSSDDEFDKEIDNVLDIEIDII